MTIERCTVTHVFKRRSLHIPHATALKPSSALLINQVSDFCGLQAVDPARKAQLILAAVL